MRRLLCAGAIAFSAGLFTSLPSVHGQFQQQSDGQYLRVFRAPGFTSPWFSIPPTARNLTPQPLYFRVAQKYSQVVSLDITLTHGRYPIEGVGLGDILSDKTVFPKLNCSPSELFESATWCQRSVQVQDQQGRKHTSTVAFLYTSDGATRYSAKIIDPAYFQPGDIGFEIERLSKLYHQKASVLRIPNRSELPSAIIAAWGGVELVSLDDADIQLLAAGSNPKVGFIVDFLGDFKRSAKEGLPVYLLKGSAGIIWQARFDADGKGMLRISAIDASQLTLKNLPQFSNHSGASQSAQPARTSVTELQPQVNQPAQAPQSATPDATSRSGSAKGDAAAGTRCSDITDAAQRLACYDRVAGAAPTAAAPVISTNAVPTSPATGSATLPPTPAEVPVVAGHGASGGQGPDTMPLSEKAAATGAAPTAAAPAISTNAVPTSAATGSATLPPTLPPTPAEVPVVAGHGASGGQGPDTMPLSEKAVIEEVEKARIIYESSSNIIQQRTSRIARAKGICLVLPDQKANGWVGTILKLSLSGEGKGILVVGISENIRVKTWNNSFSDKFDDTLIDSYSSLFLQLLRLSINQRVAFSGIFVESKADCIRESSITFRESVTKPEFIIRFTEVRPMN